MGFPQSVANDDAWAYQSITNEILGYLSNAGRLYPTYFHIRKKIQPFLYENQVDDYTQNTSSIALCQKHLIMDGGKAASLHSRQGVF